MRARKGPGPWCGTVGGYTNHRCRCPRCSAAMAEYTAQHRAAQRRTTGSRQAAEAMQAVLGDRHEDVGPGPNHGSVERTKDSPGPAPDEEAPPEWRLEFRATPVAGYVRRRPQEVRRSPLPTRPPPPPPPDDWLAMLTMPVHTLDS